MVNKLILLIERGSGKPTSFAAALKRKGYQLEVVDTGRLALSRAPIIKPALIILNAASLGSSGTRICRKLVDNVGHVALIHIMPEGYPQIREKEGMADVTLVMPFTSRKLVNRIKRLMPIDEDDVIQVGKIHFAEDVRIVVAYGREKRLTPKAAKLLGYFLDHPDETLDRSDIMEAVWETDYVGDTRTLDVHVRWVRQAIEPNPSKPHHIKTVRGVGYRFIPTPPGQENHK